MYEQFLAHLVGDYFLQSQWMAENKMKRSLPAFIHAATYSVPFLLFSPSLLAFAVIFGTHFLIDRLSLAKYLVWAKNVLFKPIGEGYLWNHVTPYDTNRFLNRFDWGNCKATGYPSDLPPWLSVMLLIISDNILHLVINYSALRWL